MKIEGIILIVLNFSCFNETYSKTCHVLKKNYLMPLKWWIDLESLIATFMLKLTYPNYNSNWYMLLNYLYNNKRWSKCHFSWNPIILI